MSKLPVGDERPRLPPNINMHPESFVCDASEFLTMSARPVGYVFEPLDDITPKEASYCALFFIYSSESGATFDRFPHWKEIERHFKVI